jgi:hypothetical protein
MRKCIQASIAALIGLTSIAFAVSFVTPNDMTGPGVETVSAST